MPLTQHHAQSLIRYADALTTNPLLDGWPFGATKEHLEEVWDLAKRIANCVTESVCSFTDDDLKLLADISDGLITYATRTIAQPGIIAEAQHDAQFQLSLGNDVGAARDALKKQMELTASS